MSAFAEIHQPKMSFSILLNSYDTNSYSGTRQNANYFINFTDVVPPQYLNRPYKVYTRFKSTANNSSVATALYMLSINFSTNTHVQQNARGTNITAVLNRVPEAPATSTDFSLQCNLFDNPPVMIDNLSTSLNQINVQVVVPSFASSILTYGAYSNMTDYVAYLFFEEC